jgi:hypothetical protein
MGGSGVCSGDLDDLPGYPQDEDGERAAWGPGGFSGVSERVSEGTGGALNPGRLTRTGITLRDHNRYQDDLHTVMNKSRNEKQRL